ncbi:MAG: endolytic transglycosylase MltG [Candidatus Electronema sp. V4]|uniref:endolytic transglycosylase MltG n=1 Tax=Candidatus Electronema sp. V4 TaxID=3454756 RepID=UPI0040558CAD
MRTFCRVFLALLLLVSLAAAGWFAHYVFTPSLGSGEVVVDIPKGAGSRQIKTLLGEKGLIKDDIRFLGLLRLLREIEKKDPPTLRAGEFSLPLGLTPLQVIRFLHTAKPVQHRVTVPEGLTMAQIAEIFAKEGWADAAVFLQLCHDKQFIHNLEVEADSLEGYLFPETYSIVRGETEARAIISTMVRRFFAVWKELGATESRELNRHQLLTLASIVEKETGAASERKSIAGVFYNRLRTGMRLQSDPTTIYGIKDFNGNLTKADLLTATPYNTYAISGLPVGPICNPGKAALEAVLHPAEVPYLYFVSKNDGSHQFSSTLEEHNQAVRKYQKRRSKTE